MCSTPQVVRQIRPEDLEQRFRYHPAKSDIRKQAYEDICSNFLTMAHYFNMKLPDGREKAVVITKLEEAMMWSIAAVARTADPND